MKKAAVALIVLFAFSSIALAETSTSSLGSISPVQISFFDKGAVPWHIDTVIGARGNIFYGNTKNVYGLDVGLVQRTTERSVGVQAGLCNISKKMDGFQLAVPYNYAEESDFLLVQLPFINNAGVARGLSVQLGYFSIAKEMTGLQLSGFGNYTEKINGVQYGGFCGLAKEMKGFQFALYSSTASGGGIQLGEITYAGEFTGFQLGAIGNVGGRFTGFTYGGFFNYLDSLKGVQFSYLFNHAKESDGLQICLLLNGTGRSGGIQFGLLNYTGQLDGFQFGLLNISKNHIMPLINWPD